MLLAVKAMLAANDTVSKVDEAFYWIGGISLFLLLGVTAAMVYFVVRYSRKRQRKVVQVKSHLGLELTWIVIPTILVMVMFWKSYEGFLSLREVPPGAMEVNVTGQSWFWSFEYPEEKLVTSGDLYLPADTDVRFNLYAPPDDVTHSFYLPDYRVKEDCVPGKKDSYMWIHTRGPGVHNIFCAEFCGRDHSKMIGLLHVLPKEDYKAWVEKRLADRNKPVNVDEAANPSSEEIQERETDKLYRTYCASCHGANGKGGLVAGARDFTSLTGWKKGPRVTEIFRTLTEGIEGTQMRSFTQLPAWDRFALAHKVRSYYQGSDLPQDSEAALKKLDEEYKLGEKKAPKKTIDVEKAIEILSGEKTE